MESFISFWNGLMATAVFGGIVAIMALIYALVLPNDGISKAIRGFVSKYILGIGLFLSGSALVSSLVYSEFIGYPPCMFCWWARVMFYPQVVLFGMALFKKERTILPYNLVLTILGVTITTYHSIIVLAGESPLPCAVGGVSCLARDVFLFGFITIPMMAAIGFATLLLSILVAKTTKSPA